jgi:hypothetical protein
MKLAHLSASVIFGLCGLLAATVASVAEPAPSSNVPNAELLQVLLPGRDDLPKSINPCGLAAVGDYLYTGSSNGSSPIVYFKRDSATGKLTCAGNEPLTVKCQTVELYAAATDDGDPGFRRNGLMLRQMLLALLTVPMSLLAQPEGQPAPANLVANGDFSQVSNGQPDKWAASGSKIDVTQTLSVEKDADGKPFARLICTRCERRGGDSHAMLIQFGQIKLAKGRPYEFTCRMRATGLRSRTVGIAIQETNGWQKSGLYDEVSLGAAWKKYRIIFRAERDIEPTGRLQIWFSEPGTLDMADVRISEIAAEVEEFTDLVPPSGRKNLAFNGSFELGGAGWTSMGTGAGWGDLSGLHGTIETSGGSHGKSFLRIPMGGGRTPVLYFDYFEPVAKPQLRPLAASLGWIKVEKGQPYVLSADLRASVDGTPAVLGARAQDPSAGWNNYDQKLKLTTAWKRYSVTFRPQRGHVFLYAGPDLPADQRVDVAIDAIQLEKSDKASEFQPHGDLEFAVEPAQPGGIFVEGESAILKLRLCSQAAAAGKAAVKFAVTDFADKAVALPGEDIELGAGETATREVRLPTDWKGYYRIRATAEAGGKSASADVRIAIVPPPAVKDSVCGINHAFVSADLIRLASKAGVTWYRDWSLKWQHMEPAKGEYHWELADTQIDRVFRERVNLMALLPPFSATDWNSEAPDSLKVTKDYPGNRLRQAFAPKDPKDLGVFTERAVTRYKDRVRVWEFLNEPVYTSYALPGRQNPTAGDKRYTPADYVALLEVAAAGMRKADPTCKVMGGIAGGPDTFTREVIEAGCLKQVDIFNLHIYPGQRTPESFAAEMDDLLARMDANGGRKPIWMTEFSYYGADNLPRRPFFPRANAWSETRLLDSERQCADYTVRFFLVMLSHGVQKVFIHSGASGRVNDPNFECALFDYGGVPRKLFPAMAVLTGLLGPQPTYVAQAPLGDGSLGHAVAFETGKAAVVAVWTEGDEPRDRVVLPADEGIVLLDIVGRKINGLAVNLSASPVYVVGPSGKAKELLAALKVKR